MMRVLLRKPPRSCDRRGSDGKIVDNINQSV